MSTNIEWTDETWNPLVGCSRMSPGCDNCYAIGVAHRGLAPQHKGLTVRTATGTDWTGEVRFVPDVLDKPLRWKRPRRIFVNSLSDLFHPAVPNADILRIWTVMRAAEQHTFQVLTKRPQRMASFVPRISWRSPTTEERKNGVRGWQAYLGGDYAGAPSFVPPNIWLGVSIESDKYAWRADHLRATPAAVRFISAEPLLGPLPSLDLTGIDWLIVGGESGPRARPMHPDWVRDLRDRCLSPGRLRIIEANGGAARASTLERGPAFLFKQHGSFRTFLTADEPDRKPTMWVRRYDGVTVANEDLIGDDMEWTAAYRMPKHEAGRTLDGRTWDEFPADRVSRSQPPVVGTVETQDRETPP